MATEIFPSEILNRTDVFCKEETQYAPIPCVYLWPGTSQVYRGRMEIVHELAPECLIHEAYHYHVDPINGCPSHGVECGWDWNELEVVLDEL